MKLVKEFNEYEIIDMFDGKKLEIWNNITLLRPDPQIIWKDKISNKKTFIDAIYERSTTGGGEWKINNEQLSDKWQIHYKDYIFNLKLMSFKHTGLFPEQSVNWDLISSIIKKNNTKLKVLNLFAYTGAASIVALKSGAEVTHVDSSKGMIDWAKENVITNNLQEKKIRFICEDVLKFVKREERRGNKYDIILMDPPTFGRGNKKEVWKIDDSLEELIKETAKLLSNNAKLFLVNSYSGISKQILENLLNIHIKNKGIIESDELGIKMNNSEIILPCGIYAKWQND